MILLLAASLTGLGVNAQTDTSRNYFRYYPEVNVYYNPSNMQYAWYDSASTLWSTGLQLPASIQIKDLKKFQPIEYSGTDVWTANPDHIKLYGNKNEKAAPPRR